MDEVIRLFNANHVRYLLIGGQAIRLEGMPRSTMDWDFYIPPRDAVNMSRIQDLLGEQLDVPLVPLGPRGENFVQTYQTKWGILQFHLAGPGLPSFDQAEKRAVLRNDADGLPVHCMCTDDLLDAKRKANRPRDQDDIFFLENKKG